LALGTIAVEASVVAIAALMILSRQRPSAQVRIFISARGRPRYRGHRPALSAHF
jgi:hypothetical protein